MSRSSPVGASINSKQHTTRTLKTLQSTGRVRLAERAHIKHNNDKHAGVCLQHAGSAYPIFQHGAYPTAPTVCAFDGFLL